MVSTWEQMPRRDEEDAEGLDPVRPMQRVKKQLTNRETCRDVLAEATVRTLDGRRRSDSNRQMLTWPCEVPNFVYKNKTKTVYTGGDSIEAQWSSESWAVPKKKKFHSCTLLK